MSETVWQELLEEAPLAVRACLHYFQAHFLAWQPKLLEERAMLHYLATQGFEVRIATFGVPNRKDWYLEVYREEALLRHERNFADRALALEAAIRLVFQELEKDLNA
ncbi:MAG: hypothetical protein KDC44_07325 [Phaeodactylibacter sp.]|nr:hypothetical protein [Phaeodactylibacter sp.]